MTKRIKIPIPVVVEGKYDRMKLSEVIDAVIVVTDGFGVFKKKEKLALIRRLAEAGGIAVLTDSDRGGRQIRGYLSSVLPPEKIYNLYIPQIAGKERRKRAPSAAGTLGVEGMDAELLRSIFTAFAEKMGFDGGAGPRGCVITKAQMYEYGLTGTPDSGSRRDAVAVRLGLPRGMSAGALMRAAELLVDYGEFAEIAAAVAAENAGEEM